VLLADYPASAVGVPGAGRSNLDPPSLAALALAFAQTGAVLLLLPWLRRLGTWRPVRALNAAALPVYLWHQATMISVTVVVAWLGGRLPGLLAVPESYAWAAARFAWLPLFAAALVLVVRLATMAPDRGRSRRPTTVLVPSQSRRAATVLVPGQSRRAATVRVSSQSRRATAAPDGGQSRRATTVWVPGQSRRATTVRVPGQLRGATTPSDRGRLRRATTVRVPGRSRRATTAPDRSADAGLPFRAAALVAPARRDRVGAPHSSQTVGQPDGIAG
jgi:hypothetical protein